MAVTTQTPNLGIPYVIAGQMQPEVPINQGFTVLDAISGPMAAFAQNLNASSGLNYAYYGGSLWNGSAVVAVAPGVVALTASATNYVQITTAGAVSANTSGFTAGEIPLAVVTTSATAITGATDARPSAIPAGAAAGMQNPMTAAGDLIVGGASGAPERLAEGTAGEVLTMTGSGPAWAAPAAAGMQNPMTTAGDLIVGGASGAPARLAEGTAGQVLTVTQNGPAWAPIPAGPTPFEQSLGILTTPHIACTDNGNSNTITANATGQLTFSVTLPGALAPVGAQYMLYVPANIVKNDTVGGFYPATYVSNSSGSVFQLSGAGATTVAGTYAALARSTYLAFLNASFAANTLQNSRVHVRAYTFFGSTANATCTFGAFVPSQAQTLSGEAVLDFVFAFGPGGTAATLCLIDEATAAGSNYPTVNTQQATLDTTSAQTVSLQTMGPGASQWFGVRYAEITQRTA